MTAGGGRDIWNTTAEQKINTKVWKEKDRGKRYGKWTHREELSKGEGIW